VAGFEPAAFPIKNRDAMPGCTFKQKKSPDFRLETFNKNVGVAGFEPAASWSQTRRDTGLRYTPKRFAKVSFKIAAANIF
jgi:hypothetical protein